MDVKVPCNQYHCVDDCDEHAYCDKHFSALIEEAKQEGYEEAKKEYST